MTAPLDATPEAIVLGTDDQSTREVPLEPEQNPTHLPKIFIYAKKGTLLPQVAVGNGRNLLYGVESFDETSMWANHATVLANVVNTRANAAMYQRVKPRDAGPNASVRAWIDVLATTVPIYERMSDGSLRIDPTTNLPIPTGATATGFKVKFVYEPLKVVDGELDYKQATEKTGDQVDATTATTSVRYPLYDTVVPSFGSDGNLAGIRMWAPTTRSNSPIDTTLLSQNRAYPLRMAVVKKADINSTPSVVGTLAAEQFIDISFKPGAVNARVKKQTYVNDIFINSYQDTQTVGQVPRFGEFGQFHLYQATVDKLSALFYEAEKPYAMETSDFTLEPGEELRFNFIGGTDSNGVPYVSYQFANDVDAVRLTENTTIYASGGSDGTMSDTLFAELVSEQMKRYADPDDVFQDRAKYPESFFWDSGFPLETKYDLINMIAIRKDTGIGLCCHDTSGPVLTASEESAIAVALRARLNMHPESEYYGTSVTRGIIVGRSGTMTGRTYVGELPVILEVASKTAGYMGAANGKWKAGQSFDRAPRNVISLFRDINVTFTPSRVRHKDWATGLNWVESFNREEFQIPALKTAYDNDTSILTSFFTMMASIEVEKVGDRAHRAFRGVDSLTDLQLIKEVRQFYLDNLGADRFDKRYTLVPEIFYTAADKARGYSWSGRVRMYGPNMKTVQTFSISAHRIEDLAQ